MDRVIREAQRSGDQAKVYASQLRAGIKVTGMRHLNLNCDHKEKVVGTPGSSWRELVCPCEGSGIYKHIDHTWEDSPVDVLSTLRIRAYLGDIAAIEVVGSPECPRCFGSGGNVVDCSYCDGSGMMRGTTLGDWLTGLLKLAEDLSDVVVSVPCPVADGYMHNSCGCEGALVLPPILTKAPNYLASST